MSKIDLNNISHSYNPNDPNPVYALNPFSMTCENKKRGSESRFFGVNKPTISLSFVFKIPSATLEPKDDWPIIAILFIKKIHSIKISYCFKCSYYFEVI